MSITLSRLIELDEGDSFPEGTLESAVMARSCEEVTIASN